MIYIFYGTRAQVFAMQKLGNERSERALALVGARSRSKAVVELVETPFLNEAIAEPRT